MSAYPGATSADLYRYAHAAIQDARGWLRAPVPLRMPPSARVELEAGRKLAVCSLLTEAGELRDLARERRS